MHEVNDRSSLKICQKSEELVKDFDSYTLWVVPLVELLLHTSDCRSELTPSFSALVVFGVTKSSHVVDDEFVGRDSCRPGCLNETLHEHMIRLRIDFLNIS